MSVETASGLRSGIEDGVEWKLLVSPLGNCVNGYVCIPAGHPWSDIADYADVPVNVHGGLTYGPEPWRDFRHFGGRLHPPRPTRWIGFDTSHYDDAWTAEELQAIGGRGPIPGLGGNTHWTVELVTLETRSLARQVAAAVPPHPEVTC